MNAGSRRRFARQRGAVLVETLVTMVPVLGFFFGVLQVTELCTADLVVQRAASAAARAAIVVMPDSKQYYPDSEVNAFSGKRQEEITRAADMILATNSNYVPNSARVAIVRRGQGISDPLTATVSADFNCGVTCVGQSVTLTATDTRAYQGAQYSYDFATLSDFDPSIPIP